MKPQEEKSKIKKRTIFLTIEITTNTDFVEKVILKSIQDFISNIQSFLLFKRNPKKHSIKIKSMRIYSK